MYKDVMDVYEVYKPIIYNDFFKEERKKRNLTLQDLSKQIHYSLGLLSQLENDTDLLNNGKTSILLIFYGYDIEYLNRFDKELNRLMNDFTNSILYINDEMVITNYKKLENFFLPYKNSILYTGFYLCDFIYNLYFFDYAKANYCYNQLSIDHYYSDTYFALLHLYLARYFIHLSKYDLAINHLTLSVYNTISNTDIIGFSNASLSACYMHKKEIGLAMKCSEEAILCFTSTNNYRRLLNTNINKGNQLLKIKDYQGALKLNNKVLETAKKLNYHFEIRALLNNNAYIYMLQNKYEDALACFEEMPKEEMKEKHYCSYVVCLVETGREEKALSLSTIWVQECVNPYLKATFKAYHQYLMNHDLRKLNTTLIKIVRNFKNSIDMFEIEYLYVLIAHHYKKLNMFKSCMEYVEKLRELDF